VAADRLASGTSPAAGLIAVVVGVVVVIGLITVVVWERRRRVWEPPPVPPEVPQPGRDSWSTPEERAAADDGTGRDGHPGR